MSTSIAQPFAPNDGMLIRPDCLPPSAWTGHIPFGAWLVAALRPRLLVELGTHHGTSYLAFCQMVRELDLPTRCLAVDTWEGDEHAGAYGNEVYDRLRRYHDPLYASFSELLRMTFDDALGSVEDGSVDLLHIDGLHTYEAVSHDFRTWRPKLSDRAVVLFHDIQERGRGFGVWRFWDELRRDFPSFDFRHSHGLGVLFVGKEIPVDVRALAGLDEAQATQVRRLFERLGEGIAARSQAEELEAALAGREQGVALYREHATALEGQVAELQRDRDAVRNALDTLRPRADAMQREIEELYHRTTGLQDDVNARQVGLEEYRTYATSLEQRVAQLNTESAAAHAALDEVRAAVQAAATQHAATVASLERGHDDAIATLARQHAATTDALMRRIDESNARLLALSVEFERIVQSRSWRATAWLRKLSSLFRGAA